METPAISYLHAWVVKLKNKNTWGISMESGAKSLLSFLGVLLIRVAIAFAVFSFAASEMAFANEVDYWAKTSLSEKNLKDFVSQNRCYTDENSFLGCINAINALLSVAKPAKILTNKEIETIPGAKETVQVIEGLKIQNLKFEKDEKKSFADDWKDTLKVRTKINKSWKLVYAQTASQQISMEHLMSVALAGLNTEGLQRTYAYAINMYLQTVFDPHTYIQSTEALQTAISKSEESFAGVGSQLQMIESKVVLTPIEGGPAQKAGLRYLDILTHVDGKSVENIPLQDISEKMVKGPENTSVKLTVQRNTQTVDINIIRAKIIIKNIEGKIISDAQAHTKIGYIKIDSFMQAGLCRKFLSIAQDLKNQGAESLVLDLRNNGGGLVDEALCMASSYIEAHQPLLALEKPDNSGKVLYVHYNNPQETWWKHLVNAKINPAYAPASLYNLYGKKPLVFLLNAHSASASELLPGALQAYGRAIIVGERSFGKGTMQGPQEMREVGLDAIGEITLMKTIARFHFANWTTNQLVGISPDFLAYSKPNPTKEDKFVLREVDLYPNAIHSSNTPQGIEAEKKDQISQCVGARNNLAREYAEQLTQATGPDYQLLNAREVAICL